MNALQQYKLYECAQKLSEDFTPLVPPEVNINGTGAEELVDQYRKVVGAMLDLDRLMGEATPHGRDYQTIEGGERLSQICRAAWMQRRNTLAMMREEIELYALCILEQQAVRRKHIPDAGGMRGTADPLPAGAPADGVGVVYNEASDKGGE